MYNIIKTKFKHSFLLEYEGLYSPKSYTLKWPLRLKVTLADIVLSIGSDDYLYPGYAFDPHMFKNAALLCDQNLTFGLNIGDGKYLSIYFEPVDDIYLKIYINKENTDLKRINFNINDVPEVLEKRKNVASQFIKVFNQVIQDVERIEDYDMYYYLTGQTHTNTIKKM